MKIFKQSGDLITITAAAATASGDFVKVGKLAGFAQTDAAIGDRFAVAVRGVFGPVAVAAAAAVAVGDAVYSDADGALTTDATDADYVGFATSAAAPVAGVAAVDIKLG
jgi:predicted RecA/RadA family phage recombinase